MTDWYLGTMGFSYESWAGVFYSADLPPRNYLAHYSQTFDAVEIDSTFYGTPRPEVVQRWAAVTPDDFKFCAKTPRLITHELGLLGGAFEEMVTFLESIRLMEDKLGPVLIQFPPSFTIESYHALKGFLEKLPARERFAVEFRHGSWYTPTGEEKTTQLLNEHQVAWAATQYPGLPVRIHLTARFLYIRWIGQHGSFKVHDRERIDRLPDLMAWWQLIQPTLDRVQEVYGFFNNDYAGHAPATCNRFKAIAGLPVEKPDLPAQGTLF